MTDRTIWICSTVLSLIMLSIFVILLYLVGTSYVHDTNQLTNTHQVQQFLQDNWERNKQAGIDPPTYIPTGLYIDSIKFLDTQTVSLNGYIWQKYPLNTPKNISYGVIFPEAGNVRMIKVYERTGPEGKSMGWHFEANFTPNFDYAKYPLDYKKLRVRMWHKDFDKNVILTPALSSYQSTKVTDTFGIDPELSLPEYSFVETFFNYKLSKYDTNFGIRDYIGRTNFPELYFNIILKRNILDAITINLLPVIAVLMILLWNLMIVTSEEESQKRTNFSLVTTLTTAGFMLLTLLVAHTDLNNRLPGVGIVYFEYLFFIMYFAIIYVVLFAFIITHYSENNKLFKFCFYDDGIIVKAAFVPIIFALFSLVTYINFFF